MVGFSTDDDEISFDEAIDQAELLDLTYFECKPTDKEEITIIFEFLASKVIKSGENGITN